MSLPMRKWEITYEQMTPMGVSSSQTYRKVVYAKTERGAEGIYNREIRQGGAYETILYNIKPIEE